MDYQSQNWLASEQAFENVGERTIFVSGEVQLLASNEVPKLIRGALEGANSRTLVLELEVTTEGDGTDLMDWVGVDFAAPISHREFSKVVIKGRTNAEIDVQQEIS